MLFSRFITLLLEPKNSEAHPSIEAQEVDTHTVEIIPPTFAGIAEGLKRSKAEPEDIVVLLSPNSWLYNEWVYSHLHKAYLTSDILFTCGQTLHYESGKLGHCHLPPPKLVVNRKYRKKGWRCQGLITFKTKLFKALNRESLSDKSFEASLLYQMLERAGNRIHFFKDVQQIGEELPRWTPLLKPFHLQPLSPLLP